MNTRRVSRENYSAMKNTYAEKFFVTYAIRSPYVNHPIEGPVSEPSPLNNRWIYDPIQRPISKPNPPNDKWVYDPAGYATGVF